MKLASGHTKLLQYIGALAVLGAVLLGTAYISALTGVSSTSVVLDQQTNICSTQIQNDKVGGLAVRLTQASPDVFCVKYFYYNSTNTETLSPASVLGIFGNSPVGANGTRVVDDSSLFTITATPSQLQIGGPQSVNEGAIVIYTITVKSGTPSGDYYLAINAVEYPQMAGCGSTLDLIVGNAHNTNGGGTCVNLPLDPSMPYHYSLDSQGFVDGLLFSEVVGLSGTIVP